MNTGWSNLSLYEQVFLLLIPGTTIDKNRNHAMFCYSEAIHSLEKRGLLQKLPGKSKRVKHSRRYGMTAECVEIRKGYLGYSGWIRYGNWGKMEPGEAKKGKKLKHCT